MVCKVFFYQTKIHFGPVQILTQCGLHGFFCEKKIFQYVPVQSLAYCGLQGFFFAKENFTMGRFKVSILWFAVCTGLFRETKILLWAGSNLKYTVVCTDSFAKQKFHYGPVKILRLCCLHDFFLRKRIRQKNAAAVPNAYAFHYVPLLYVQMV